MTAAVNRKDRVHFIRLFLVFLAQSFSSPSWRVYQARQRRNRNDGGTRGNTAASFFVFCASLVYITYGSRVTGYPSSPAAPTSGNAVPDGWLGLFINLTVGAAGLGVTKGAPRLDGKCLRHGEVGRCLSLDLYS